VWKTKRILKTAAVAAVVLAMSTFGTVSAYAARLVPVGSAVGIEVAVDGALVEDLSKVAVEGGTCCPADDAGIKPGDVITGVNGKVVHSLAEFAEIAKSFDGSAVTISVSREGKSLDFAVTPIMSIEGRYQVGLWLRDMVAGVGTVTYYNPETGEYGALGHGINDTDTGALIPITRGQTYDASVVDVVQGKKGTPGELTGSFDSSSVFGTVASNTVYGIFGICDGVPNGAYGVLETAVPGEVQVGEATVLTTVDGAEPREYTINIDRVQQRDGEERYQITVTDPDLLEITGGVVCGMSGSPIIQEGKLVGAVTHVLVNDPTRGYGIFIENMLDAAS